MMVYSPLTTMLTSASASVNIANFGEYITIFSSSKDQNCILALEDTTNMWRFEKIGIITLNENNQHTILFNNALFWRLFRFSVERI